MKIHLRNVKNSFAFDTAKCRPGGVCLYLQAHLLIFSYWRGGSSEGPQLFGAQAPARGGLASSAVAG